MRPSDTAGALVALSTTHEVLKRIPADDNEINNEIEAAVLGARNFGMEPDADFRRLHRLRRPSCHLDDNPATATSMLSNLTHLRYEFFKFRTEVPIPRECLSSIFESHRY